MKPNPVWDFTVIFVRDFLGDDHFDSRKHGRYLREMKQFVNPSDDKVPVDGEDVIGCLRAMNAGMFGFDGEINSIWCITYGEPWYIGQYFEWKKEPPPWYDTAQVELWERITNLKAYPKTPARVTMAFLPTRPQKLENIYE